MAVTDEDFVSRWHFADILAEGIAGSSLGAERYEIKRASAFIGALSTGNSDSVARNKLEIWF